MQIIYHFEDINLQDYEIVYLPGPNNPFSPYKKFRNADGSFEKSKSTLKPSSIKRLKQINLSENDLDAIITEFIDLYASIFTDPDEREDTDGLISRVKGLEKVTGQTILVICVRKTDREVVGGFIFELHRASSCLLLTYIFTKQNERGRGIGYSLIQTVLPYMVSNLMNVKIKAVFLETENPAFTPISTIPTQQGSIDAANSGIEAMHHKRLAFFRKAGAKWLDVSYVQPRLSTDPKDFGNRVYHLFFLMLPDAIDNKELLADKRTIFDFLFNFYNTLEYSDRKKLSKRAFSINLSNADEKITVEDIDLHRSYLQMELLDTLYQFKAVNNQSSTTIIDLINSLRNQFQFVALEVKKVKEYINSLSSKGFDEPFTKELTQILIEKISGLNENPVSTNAAIQIEYEKYLLSYSGYINYRNLYIQQGNKCSIKANEVEGLVCTPDDQRFYSLDYIAKTLSDLKNNYLPINTCSHYNAFINEIPSGLLAVESS